MYKQRCYLNFVGIFGILWPLPFSASYQFWNAQHVCRVYVTVGCLTRVWQIKCHYGGANIVSVAKPVSCVGLHSCRFFFAVLVTANTLFCGNKHFGFCLLFVFKYVCVCVCNLPIHFKMFPFYSVFQHFSLYGARLSIHIDICRHICRQIMSPILVCTASLLHS